MITTYEVAVRVDMRQERGFRSGNRVDIMRIAAESPYGAADTARVMFGRQPGVLDLHTTVTGPDGAVETFAGLRATFPMGA